jgi:hypothetical protein
MPDTPTEQKQPHEFASAEAAPKLSLDLEHSPLLRRTLDPRGASDADITARMPHALIAEVEAWAAKNATSSSEAFRRLVEIGLKAKQARGYSDQQKRRAKEMAGEVIDANSDDDAHADDQARRKRRLIKGPEEFRDLRIDRKPK